MRDNIIGTHKPDTSSVGGPNYFKTPGAETSQFSGHFSNYLGITCFNMSPVVINDLILITKNRRGLCAFTHKIKKKLCTHFYMFLAVDAGMSEQEEDECLYIVLY